MPKNLDLSGKKFGKWKVLGRGKTKGDKVYWICECECGRTKEVQASTLVNGRSQSCGKCGFPIRDFSHTEKRICDICGAEFEIIPYGKARRFCYECSPLKSYGGAAITPIRKAIKKQLVLYKGGKCEVCGYDKCMRALQFHHTNPEEKDFSISATLNNGMFDMDKYRKEIDKCILVCANCHAEIHEQIEKGGKEREQSRTDRSYCGERRSQQKGR